MAVGVDDGVGRFRKMKVLCVLIVLLCVHLEPVVCRRKKHPPVQAFFQGDCNHHICEQRCRNIDNGGYACECNKGYRLDHNGISCSKITKDHLYQKVPTDPDAPVDIRIVSDADENTEDFPFNNDIHLSHSHDDLTLQSSVLHSASSHVYQKQSDSDRYEDPHITASSAINDPTVDADVDIVKSAKTGKHNKELVNKVVVGEFVDSEHSIKLVTLDEKVNTLPLETENLRNSELRNDKDLQRLVPNPLPKSSGGVRTGKWKRCDEFSCLNNGRCIDDGTVLRDKERCDCPLGTHGARCEHVVDVRYPKFHGTGYLALPVLRDGYKELDVLIEFKPESLNGLLFFSAEFEDARSDYISVALLDGYIELRYDCGTGMGVIRSTSTVAMETWNTIKVHRENNKAKLWLNKDEPVYGSSQGSYTRLTLRLNLYLGGYDNMDLVSSKVGTDQRFSGCIEEVVVNGYKYDLRKSGLVGDAVFGANVGECNQGQCERVECRNQGQCRVTSPDTHVCLCPLGTGGENCQHVFDVHIPAFQGHSYLELQGLGRTSLLFLEIEIVLKSTKPDGLILYNGYTLDRSGDFISLALHGGYLEYRFDLGTGPAVIRSPKPVTLNHWHWVKLSRTGMEGVLEVDGQQVAIGQSQGAFTQLTVTQNMYIGGHRNFDETSRLANLSESFEGCVQKVIINNHHVHLLRDAQSGVNIENCEHPCVGEPCLNDGECLPSQDSYMCSCPLGYKGHNCQKKINRQIDNPHFSGQSFLKITNRDIARKVSGDKIDIQFSIRPDPDTKDGLLFWSGQDVMEPTSDYIALGFKDGALLFRYNLGSGEAVISYNSSKLYNGQWHSIHAQRNKQAGYLSIDDVEVVEGSSKGSYTMLNTNKELYIGGMPDARSRTLQKFASGFKGCLKDMVLGGDTSQDILSSAESGRNVVPCH